MFGIKKKEKKTALSAPKEQAAEKQSALTGGTEEVQRVSATATQTKSAPASRGSKGADDLLRELEEREDFSYDPTRDPLYEYYRQEYLRNGALAMEDAMGQAAALTGGYGNSYAQTVGQQVYGDYGQKSAEALPQLYQMAWDQYREEGEALQEQYRLQKEREEEAFDLALSMLYGGAIPSEELLEQSGMEIADAVRIFEQANPDAFAETAADMVYYRDARGDEHIGYVIDGMTYADPQGHRAIPVYSTVTLSDGSRWYKGNSGSVLLPDFGRGMEENAFEGLMEELRQAHSYEQINQLLSRWTGQMSEKQWQEVETWLTEAFDQP